MLHSKKDVQENSLKQSNNLRPGRLVTVMPKIMLAEDDRTMITLLKTLLDMEGYQVVALGENDDIFEAVRQDRPDVLLLDVHLPNANGLDVLAQVRANAETNDLSVVMTSGLNLEEECLRSGANGFLLKPYMPDDLLSLLKRSLSQS
jgi:CheY-like chemotaxis protein